MRKKMNLSLLFFAFVLPIYSEAVDCPTLPDNTTVENAFKTLLASQGGEGDPANVFIQDGPYYTCQVQGTTMGTYQEVAVIMTYTTSTDPTTQIGQIAMDCVGSGNNVGWDSRSNSLSKLSSSVDYMNIPLFTNCSSCTIDANNENYCEACHSNCNVGLMRCTGTSNTSCCVGFETNGECIPDLNCDQNNFVADEQNNFTCACGLTSCGDGYFFNSTFCNCDLTDLCQADNPCANGVCTLVSAPDEYTCDCTGTEYMGTNCSVSIPVVVTSSSVVMTTSSDIVTSTSTTTSVSSTSTSTPCSNGCATCNSSCCTTCSNGFDSNGCNCVVTGTKPPDTCTTIRGCLTCPDDCCEECENGFTTSRSTSCTCVEDTTGTGTSTSTSSSQSLTPTSTTDRSSSLNDFGITGIIISIVIGVLILLVLIALIGYVIYYFMAGSAVAAAKAKYTEPIMLGEAHDNPMYLDPELIS